MSGGGNGGRMRSGWVLAGTQSGVGKTSVALGLARWLHRRGVRVQTCKAGPDYLDPTWLARASGRGCCNLDTWMCGRAYVRARVAECAAEAVLVEGVMGLFDGVEPGGGAGSTAELAEVLGWPVVLVVDASGMAGSVAALVHGFASFSSAVRLAGVIANRVGSARHADILREALEAAGLPPLLGAVRKGAFPVLESRHLGLLPADLTDGVDTILDAMADVCGESVDVERLLRLTALLPAQVALSTGEGVPLAGTRGMPGAQPETSGAAPDLASSARSKTASPFPAEDTRPRRIGLARDEAFCFHYPDTLAMLEDMGVTWVPFSPLRDRELPENLDAIYLAGGYPEAYLEPLSGNESMRRAVGIFCAGGGAVYAECGGLLYLCNRMEDREGRTYPMVGGIPASGRMQAHRARLGMVEVETRTGTFFGPVGTILRGHEYHYSILQPDASANAYTNAYAHAYSTPHAFAHPDPEPDPDTDTDANQDPDADVGSGAAEWFPAYTVRYRDGTTAPEGFARGRILASYVHLHLASHPQAAHAFVRAIAAP